MNLNYEVSKEILETGRTKNKIICMLEAFLKSGKEIAKVEYAKENTPIPVPAMQL